MSQQGVLNNTGGGSGNIMTLSSEGGPHTPPAGNNFNFSGSVVGGSATNGALHFTTPGGPGAATNGQMDANVLVDGTTITINGSNQLTATAQTYYSITPFIVGSDIHSQYTTIAAAMAAAPTNSYIFIKPGSYAENLHATKNVTLIALSASADFLFSGNVDLTGQMTIDPGVGVGINGLDIQDNGGSPSFSITNTSNLLCQNCVFNPLTSTMFLINSANANVTLDNCNTNLSNSGTPFSLISGFLRITNSYFNTGNKSTTVPSTVSGGFMQIINSVLNVPISTSGAGVIYAQNSTFGDPSVTNPNLTWITTAGTGANYFSSCNIFGGTASCMSIGTGTTVTIVHSDLNSSNTNVATGAGTLVYALVSFSGSSSGHNVTTETPLPTLI